jgi:hypothetical protein
VIRVGPPGHHVGEVVVGVDARPLLEALGRLDGQVVELEGVGQKVADRAVRRLVVKVEPEEVLAGQGGVHVLIGGGRVGAALAQGPGQHGPSLSAPGRTLVDTARAPAVSRSAGSAGQRVSWSAE